MSPVVTRRLGAARAVVIAAIACSNAAVILSQPSHAQTRAAQERPPTYDFNIPEQSLARAIAQLCDVAGFQVLYAAEQPNHVKSRPVAGRMSADEALRALLSGSGFTYRFVRPGVLTIEKLREGVRSLGPVRVEGTGGSAVNGVNGSRDFTATEGTGSFTTGAMTIGTKAPRSIKDTPQSVSVLTNEQLEQQNINDFASALAQAPGISFAQGNTSLETTFYSRGFPITWIQIDGGAPLTTRFAGSANVAYFPQIDLSQYDHVEVLRGAAGLFNGYGDPSGVINLVRKKPLDREQVRLDAEWGSWNRYRAVLDATAPLALDGELRGRMVLTWQSNKHFYEIAKDQKTLLYGIVEYDFRPTTLVTAGVSHSSQDGTPWSNGLPRYQTGEDLRLPRKTGLLFPWNRWDFETTEIFGSIGQQLGDNWATRLNITHSRQASTQKLGYTSFAVNPVDNRGPRLVGTYQDFASDQFSAEGTLSGTFTLLGQRQLVTFGLSRSDQDGGGRTEYDGLINGSADRPYQPYPGSPLYCPSATVCPDTRIATPPIDVFAFNPFDPLYTEPRNPLPYHRRGEQGQVQSLIYVNLRLTAFDRLHLETGVRWSRYEFKDASDSLCISIPTSGTPTPANCVGRRVGDAYNPNSNFYSGEEISWPPSVALSYDITGSLVGFLGYTDIFEDQSAVLDGDLEPLDPVTGENVELGLKWAAQDGRLNAALSLYRIRKQGFANSEPNLADRYKLNPDGTIFLNADGQHIVIANDGTELPEGRPDPYHICCYIRQQDRTQVSEGVDAELTGEVLPGWQVSASYTFSRNKQEGEYFSVREGQPFTSIQPEHLYKLWTTLDLGAAGVPGWLSRLTLSGGVNGQSEGYRSGQTCPDGQVGQPDPFTGFALCLVPQIPYEFTVEPYAVVSGRIGYRLNNNWSAALELENIVDKTYYHSVGSVSSGNWYGAPRSFTLTVRSTF